MNAPFIVSVIWFRAQGVYAGACIALAILAPVWEATWSGAAAADIAPILGIALLVSLFALVAGLPAWMVWAGVMAGLDRYSGQLELSLPVWLVTGLLATTGALYTGFSVLLGTDLTSGDVAGCLCLGIPAYAAMIIAVFSVRAKLRGYKLYRPEAARH